MSKERLVDVRTFVVIGNDGGNDDGGWWVGVISVLFLFDLDGPFNKLKIKVFQFLNS